jgi:hypothetical protein
VIMAVISARIIFTSISIVCRYTLHAKSLIV